METSLEISCVHIVHMTAIPNAKNIPHSFTNGIIFWRSLPNICVETSNHTLIEVSNTINHICEHVSQSSFIYNEQLIPLQQEVQILVFS